MYTTDDAGRRYIKDQAASREGLSRPAPVNWKNERAHPDDAGLPHGESAGGPVIHIHGYGGDACDEETEDRLNTLEHAVARIVHDHYNFDESEDGATEGSQAGSSRVRHGPPEDAKNDDYYQQPREATQAFTQRDTLPSTPEEINRANQAYWNTTGHNLTGGSQSLPPNSKAAESGGYLPNQAGSIDEPRVTSTTNRSLTQKTFGVTADSLRRGEVYKQQMRQTNSTINSINAANARFYGRKGN